MTATRFVRASLDGPFPDPLGRPAPARAPPQPPELFSTAISVPPEPRHPARHRPGPRNRFGPRLHPLDFGRSGVPSDRAKRRSWTGHSPEKSGLSASRLRETHFHLPARVFSTHPSCGGLVSVVPPYTTLGLDPSAVAFCLEPARLRGASRRRRTARFGSMESGFHEFPKPLPRHLPIPCTTSMAVRVNDENALTRKARTQASDQPDSNLRPDPSGIADVPAQGHTRVRGVDVLPARAPRAARQLLDLAHRNPVPAGKEQVGIPNPIASLDHLFLSSVPPSPHEPRGRRAAGPQIAERIGRHRFALQTPAPMVDSKSRLAGFGIGPIDPVVTTRCSFCRKGSATS